MTPSVVPITRQGETGSSAPTRIAILGCGYWGVNYVRVFEELPESRVVVVCDRDPSKLAKVARAFPHISLTTEVDDVFADDRVDAVVVATSARTHDSLTHRALKAGYPVLVEKPLTTASHTAANLAELADKCGQPLVVGHTFLYNRAVRKVKEYVDRDDVYYLYARRTNLGPIRNDVNVVWDLAPHDVSIFNYLLESEPDWVTAVGARVLGNDRDDVAFISLGYPQNVLAHIHVSWADPHKVREVVVVSSERRVVFNDVDPVERVRVYDKGVKSVPADDVIAVGEHRLLVRDGDILSPALPPSEPLREQCSHFLDCVRHGAEPFTPASQGIAVVRVLEAIDESMAVGGRPVPVHPPLEAAAG